MSAILILLAASLSVAILFLVAFIISIQRGQFEDDFSPASRILFENEKKNQHI